LNDLLPIFVNNLLPIFLIAGTGALLGHFTSVNPRFLSQLILYIFSPCLIFVLLTSNKLSNDQLVKVILFSFIFIFIIGGITWVASRLIKADRTMSTSMILTTMFTNAGNYGLPVVLFAFGETGLGIASLYFVTNICVAFTAGTLIASMGSMDFSKALANLFKLPLVYAVILAILFMNTGWSVPVPLERTTKLLGDATIPSMLILLGLQLKTVRLTDKLLPLGAVSAVRLLLSPLLAVLLLPWFGLSGVAVQALTLQAGMPTAVITTMLATEYDAEPSFATASVFLTTLISPLTLTPLMALLGA
jgi:hypothetical protein